LAPADSSGGESVVLPDGGRRRFAIVENDGTQRGEYTAQSATAAIRKIAREEISEPASSEEEAKQDMEIIRIQNLDTGEEHIYRCWAFLDDNAVEIENQKIS